MNAALDFSTGFLGTVVTTVFDVLPILAVLVVFQVAVLRRRVPNLGRIVAGFLCVLLGLALFLIGLEQALFPIGETMARQLTEVASNTQFDATRATTRVAPTVGLAGDAGIAPDATANVDWRDYMLVYAFAAAIGFAATIAEPPLIAVAKKAEEVSGGTIGAWGLRIAVAVGVAAGVSLGCFRIVTGTPLPWYIVAAYVVVILQTFRASRSIIPLAYDSGGVTTSTVTVPVVAALGLGLAANVPGRNPLIDGFGLIAFASVFPIMSVLGYAAIATLLARLTKGQGRDDEANAHG